MASLKTEEEIEVFKQIAHVYKVAEKMTAAALDLMKSAKTKEMVDRAHRVSSDAEEVVQIASIIKSQMRKLSEKEDLYVEALDFQIGSHLPRNVSDITMGVVLHRNRPHRKRMLRREAARLRGQKTASI